MEPARIPYQRSEAEVAGGTLAYGRWGRGERIVLASHGITANHMSWLRIAELVVEGSDGAVSVVAVDHRGRAASASTPGPYGLAAHADDLASVLDHLGAATAVLAGHSMGAFVVAVAAERHPARVDHLVLVDGGLPLAVEVPPGADVEAVVRSVIGPALDRLDMRWPDEDAYLGFFRAHPAFAPPNEWTRAAEAYVRADVLRTDDGQVGSSVRKEAVLVDGGAAITDPRGSSAIERVDVATTLLWAPRGLLDQEPGLYPAEVIADATARLGHLEAIAVPDTNHYTIGVGERGAAAVARALLDATRSRA